MGCVYSRVEKEETVRRCKERKRLMKQLVRCRCELAAAHLAYLQSLRNTGATLRQFTEDESVIPDVAIPPSPLPLPPSPPPPPPFSPDSRKDGAEEGEEERREAPNDEESIEIENDSEVCTPPPPPIASSAWEYWDPFDPQASSNSSSPAPLKKDNGAMQEAVEEENWAETNTEFAEEEELEMEQEGLNERESLLLKLVKDKSPPRVDTPADDNSSATSWFTKDSEMAMVVWKNKKTMAGIVKELDDYFLKASAGGAMVVGLLDSNRNSCLHQNFTTKGKSSKSAKVFSSLSWRWSSRSPLSSKDAFELQAAEVCRSVSHCMTLDKLYAEEQRLYKEVKEEEVAKMKHRKKILLLHKQEVREEEYMKVEKTRSSIVELQTHLNLIQESINGTCFSISKLRDEELHAQLVDLSSGLIQMWRTMYECHQVQNHIAQQANHLHNLPSTEPSSNSHRHATSQLEAEIGSWYNTFHKLLKSQREYAHTLNKWVRLTDCLPNNNGLFGCFSGVYALCEEWQLALDRLPDKVASEAIKSFASVIHSIGLQLIEEGNLQKKSERLEKRLEKEMNTLNEMERTYDVNSTEGTTSIASKSKHLLTKHAKLDDLKKRAEQEKSKYLNSIGVSRAMTLTNLQTSLPNVFRAMTGFAGLCVQAYEGINRHSGTPPGATHTNLPPLF